MRCNGRAKTSDGEIASGYDDFFAGRASEPKNRFPLFLEALQIDGMGR
jgi:hypothetical protein